MRCINDKTIKNYWNVNKERMQKFNNVNAQKFKEFGSKPIYVDHENKLFCVGGINEDPTPLIYELDEVESCEFQKMGEKTIIKTRGGITRAIAGNLIAGGVGAIVGSNTADREVVKQGGQWILKIKLMTYAGKKQFLIVNPPCSFVDF